jgi:hypothetical protein
MPTPISGGIASSKVEGFFCFAFAICDAENRLWIAGMWKTRILPKALRWIRR